MALKNENHSTKAEWSIVRAMTKLRSAGVLLVLLLLAVSWCQEQKTQSPSTSSMTSVNPDATFVVGGDPDWMAVSEDAVWVTSSKLNLVTELRAASNVIGRRIPVADPCSGLVAAFGSLWIPSCGNHEVVRADLKTAKVQARIPLAPADSEGCIAAGAGSIWIASSAAGVLSRIDPRSNSVVGSISVPSGSFCPVFGDGFVWVTSTTHSLLTKVDPASNRAIAEIFVGKNPRFATTGAGSVWTLNQGDGTISRVEMKSARLISNIPAGLAGHGGEITFGLGCAWATIIGTPLTRVEAKGNLVVHRWKGNGGDSVRAGHGSIWLTDLKGGLVWRISPDRL
jgi:virginiamycin B lyase